MKSKQLAMLKNEKSSYGGALLKTRVGRSHARPLATRGTMHLVLRSTKAKGAWSFRAPRNFKNIQRIVQHFTARFGVRVISMANVGNHLHLQIKLANRFAYRPFIRAVTGAIAISVTGRTRWAKTALENTEDQPRSVADFAGGNSTAKLSPPKHSGKSRLRFWDERPFTRIVSSYRAYLNLQDYVRINQLEGCGYRREDARFILTVERMFESGRGSS